jgi:CheY-like chemotaxis protein
MSKRVLIVDDEADIRTFLETLLKEHGYETASADDGERGFELAQEFKPHIVTLDIIMPHETGVKFYRKLLKHPELKHVPVIILSGVTRYKELFARDHATMPRPYAFIDKPIESGELLEVLKSAPEAVVHD